MATAEWPRLWQTALPHQWKQVFQHLPIESHMQIPQTEYYNAISACHVAGKSDAFIVLYAHHDKQYLR